MPIELNRTRIIGKGKKPAPASAGNHFYFEEIALQAEFGLRAYGEIRDRIDRGDKDLSSFAFCQLLLGSAAIVSKILFPSSTRGAAKSRGQRLRSALAVGGDTLVSARRARNYVEHFDERLDEHLFGRDGVLIHRVVIETWESVATLDDGRVLSARAIQALEISTRTLVLLDERLSLDQLASDLTRIRDAARLAASSA